MDKTKGIFMRYLLITYLRQARGQIDEQVGFSKKVKPADLQTCNVIIDYKERKIVKCVIESKIHDTDFDKLNDYYRQVYPELIAQLERVQQAESLDKNGR
jgi:non-homologous end joining protein Ku